MLSISTSCCVNCGSFFPTDKLLCRDCESALLRAEFCGMKVELLEQIVLCTLFDWIPERSDSLSSLFLALKGVRQKKAWKSWSVAFWSARSALVQEGEPFIFYSAPRSTAGLDHAALFGKSLADLAGGRWLGSLEKEEHRSQRGRGKRQRSSLKVRTPVNIPRGRVILVDDVVTTGATAKACFEALGRPNKFEVWSLGKRTLSCEDLGDLL